MALILKLIVISVFLAALVINSEEKDLELDTFAVTKRLKEHVGTLPYGDHEIHDNAKRYSNETTALVKHGRTNGIRYRSKRMRKPDADEDLSISEYYRHRRRSDFDYNNDYANFRSNSGNGGRRRSNNNRGKPFGRNYKNSCQTCGKMLGQSGGQGLNYYSRVIDGKIVKPTFKYPFIVSISRPEVGLYCGGAIISATFVLTAAHCVMSTKIIDSPQCKTKSGIMPDSCFYKPNEITLNLLGHQPDEKSQRPVRIAKVIPHPKFNLKEVLHDIALIQVASPIQCNQFASPICLPDSDLHKMGQNLIIAGFGFNTGEGHKSPRLLREGTVKQVRPQVCKRYFKKFKNDLNDIVCAIGTESRQSSCRVDSGSSIFAKFKNKVYTLGVTSKHSSEGCKVDMPATYAKTFRYMKFIKHYVKDLPGSQGYHSN